MITCQFEDGGKALLRHATLSVYIFNTEKNKILLIKRSEKYSEPHKWAPPGGYMDRDENLSEAAVREAREETGHEVKLGELLRINDNPDRPKEDKQNLDFAFLAQASEQLSSHDEEISQVRWFLLSELPPPEEFAFDLYDNVLLAIKYNNNPFPIPVIGKITR